MEETLWRRSDTLKADRALAELERLTYAGDDPASRAALLWLRDELDGLRLEPDMHALEESWALHQVTSGAVRLPEGLEDELRRVATHADARERLGAASAGPGELRGLALEAATRWRTFVNHAGTSPGQAAVASVICTSFEGLWRALADRREVAR
jgi:hypothetical protein